MQLDVRWDGSNTPFEGDRSVPLTGIPAAAQVLSARVTVTPVDPGAATGDPDDSFVERIHFSGGGPRFGASLAHGNDFAEVDFRARRTLASVTVDDVVLVGTHGATLQIDPGGAYVEVNDVGAIRTPGDDLFEFLTNGTRALPSFVVARFKITNQGPNDTPDITAVAVRSVPENVSLRLGDQPPFHTFLGPLTETGTSADFATLLAEFLEGDTPVDGHHSVPLVIHSDSIARLDVTVSLDLLVAHQPLTAGVGEAAMEFDVAALPVGAATSFSLTLPVEARAVAGRTAVRFRGAFDDSRIALGPLAPTPADEVRIVSPLGTATGTPEPQAQAQPFTLPASGIDVTGIDLLLTPTTPAAQVQVDIRDDLGGKPGTQSLLSRPLTLDLRQTSSASAQWLTVPLPQPLHLERQKTWWLVVQRSLGSVAWSVRAPRKGQPGLQMTDDGALSWHRAQVGTLTDAEGLFRLRHRPAAFTMPIHVFVGEAPDAAHPERAVVGTEVPLAQFEPLGRVDFVLDTEELSSAINDAIEAGAARTCQPVEHLANGDMEAWFRIGDRPQPARLMLWPHTRPRAIAMAPDALYCYVLEVVASHPVVRVFDAMCLEPRQVIVLSALDEGDEFQDCALAVAPSGNRLFAAHSRRIWAVDLEQGLELAHWDEERQVVGLGVGGGALLVARATGASGLAADVRAISLQAAEAPPADGTPPESRPITTLEQVPQAFAVSPSGDRVSVAFDVDSATPAGLLVAYGGTGREQARIDLPFRPGGVALSSRQGRALVGDRTNGLVHVVDLERQAVTATNVAARIVPSQLALAAINGDRAAAAGFGDLERPFVSVIDFGVPLPQHWTVTAGVVTPVCVGEPLHIAARLGEAGREPATPLSAISQIVAVSGGCIYDFSFRGLASSDGATGEVIWRGTSCSTATPDTPVPIAVAAAKLSSAARRPELVLHRVRLQAPADATQAEVRFRASDGVAAFVDVASLRPPDGPLSNGDLQETAPTGTPLGWTLEPADTPAFRFEAGRIENLGTDPLTVFQDVAVVPSDTFRLEFRGDMVIDRDPPVLAVHWLDADAAPVSVTLDGGTSTVRLAEGVVPAEATRAEVSLTLPGGSAVAVTHLALRTRLLTNVRISVFAEAPGSLTVSQFQVVTDTTAPVPPVPPAGGLCPPTRPGDECSDTQGSERYCPVCKSVEPTRAGRPSVLDGRAVTLDSCETCGSTQVTSSGRGRAVRRVPTLPSVAIAPRPLQGARGVAAAAANGLLTPLVSHRPSPLLVIRGISKAEVAMLTQRGILSLDAFIAIAPEALAALLPSKSLRRARLLQGLARKARDQADRDPDA